MPLIARYVEPEELHKTPLLQGVLPRKNELERMAVASLATVIRQLSSLAKHAESIMGDIADVLVVCHHRSQALEERVHRLKVDIIPSLSDEVLSEFKVLPSGCHFQSDKMIDQQVLCIHRATPALQHQYNATEKVPPFELLTPFTEDGRRASQLYSDPGFFFENWRANQILENASPRVKLRKQNSSAHGEREHHHQSSKAAAKRRSTMQRQKRSSTLHQGVGRRQSFGGSELNMRVERFRATTPTTSKAAKAAKAKPEQYHMLTNLSKVQAEVYINTSPAPEMASPKESGTLKRTFSLRKLKADKRQQHRGDGGTLWDKVRASSVSEDGHALRNNVDQEASKQYGGLSQRHMEALGLSPPQDVASTSNSAVPRKNAVTDGTVTFRAPKAARDRPVSLLLYRWDGHHSPKASKRLQLFNYAVNPEANGSLYDLRTSSPSACSTLSSTSHKTKRVVPPPPLSEREVPGEDETVPDATLTSQRDGFFSASRSMTSKVDGVLEPYISDVLEPYQSGDVPGAQSHHPSNERGNSAVENSSNVGGGGPMADVSYKMDPQGLPHHQDSLVTLVTDTQSLLTLDDQSSQAAKAFNPPVAAWHDSPLFNAHGDPPTESEESKVADGPSSSSCSSKPVECGQQGNTLTPSAQTLQSEVRTLSSHTYGTSDLNSLNEPFDTLQLPCQHSKATPIVANIGPCTQMPLETPTYTQPPTTMLADGQAPISAPLDLGKSLYTAVFAHCQPPNSIPFALQNEPVETTTPRNHTSISKLPYLQPASVASCSLLAETTVSRLDAPISAPLDLGKSLYTAVVAHCQPPNSIPLALQNEPVETTTPHNHTSISKLPYLQPASVASCSLLAETTVSRLDASADQPVNQMVPPTTGGYPQHGIVNPKSQLFRASKSKVTEAPLVRENLLEAIRAGLQLRKVTLEEKNRITDTSVLPWDVAAILERRVAIASESDNDSNSDDDASEWGEGEW